MITVGIIGPISSHGSFLVNVADGIRAGCILIAHGFAPYCPHLDYQYILADRGITADMLKAVSLAWIVECEVVLALPGWRESPGAIAEYDACNAKDIPVFESIGKILEWRKGREK